MTWQRVIYLAVFALALTVYAVMLTWTLPAISAAAGGLVPFDMRPLGYTAEEARAFLAALGDEGRAIYEGPQRWLDRFYPALLAGVLAGAVAVLFANRGLRLALLAAVIAGMAADYVENILVADLLEHDGAVSDQAVRRASLATVVKSAATSLVMVAVLLGLGGAVLRRLRRA